LTVEEDAMRELDLNGQWRIPADVLAATTTNRRPMAACGDRS